MGNTFIAITGNETKQKFSFIMHSHKFGFHKGLLGFTWFWKEIWQVIEYKINFYFLRMERDGF